MKVEIDLNNMKECIMNNLKEDYKKVAYGYITPTEYSDRVRLLGNIVSDMFFGCSDKEVFGELKEFLSTLEELELDMKILDETMKAEKQNRLSKMELPF